MNDDTEVRTFMMSKSNQNIGRLAGFGVQVPFDLRNLMVEICVMIRPTS